MVQNTVRVGVLATWALWVVVGLFVLAGWIVWLANGSTIVAELLGLTAAVFVGPATVAHCRLYACRLAFLVRATASAETTMPPPAPLRSVGG